jgi:hypothetical protein
MKIDRILPRLDREEVEMVGSRDIVKAASKTLHLFGTKCLKDASVENTLVVAIL